MVLDEPNANLDCDRRDALVGAVQHLKQNGSTVIFVTHKTNMLTLADKVLLMEQEWCAFMGNVKRFGEKFSAGRRSYLRSPSLKSCLRICPQQAETAISLLEVRVMANISTQAKMIHASLLLSVTPSSSLAFVVLGGWAAITPLGSAVVASGVVTTEGNKKTIQHLEGGIVKEILIREGQHVDAGEVILRMDDTAPGANLEIYRNQLYAAVARETRLAAELAGTETVQFPDELTAVSDDPIAAKAIEDQVAQFKERRASLEGQVSILLTCGTATPRDSRP